MNQLNTCNPINDDGSTSRRCAGFPLNSTLVSYFTPDTIRSIITNAANGKPYTTAVWIRLNRKGIQISAQDPKIARTRIPVFISLSLIHDIFLHQTITNIICIVYDEVKSNMKGVLLYVVHPTDAHLVRDDFRVLKQSFYSKGVSNPNLNDETTTMTSSTSQKTSDSHRNLQVNRFESPRRIFYIRDNETGTNREVAALSQFNCAQVKNSYHSSRDPNVHNRHRSPKTARNDQSPSKPASENERPNSTASSSSSIEKSEFVVQQENPESTEKLAKQNDIQQEQDKQLIETWQATQIVPIIPMGIYNRYMPKAIPLQTGATLTTTPPSVSPNGQLVTRVELQSNGTVDESNRRSPSRSRSVSSKRQDYQQRNRSSSAQNAAAATKMHQTIYHYHHRHNGSTRIEPQKYGTVSHSGRKRANHLPMVNPEVKASIDQNEEMKRYLKQLVDDMQTIKFEMNKMRQSSAIRGRSDSLRVNLKEIRHDIDALRARMAITSKAIHA